ncbi:hypothetical protein QYE76_015207 [Lolium multiflorum]|uniref:Uncharacterized protein n=1 Tax=Lolium multiflorum TaxID=4521 RepID=A0AAD8X7J1_LOLMU|nr:hypothetical protein QYE76_015207 [Lolium multiflorum]
MSLANYMLKQMATPDTRWRVTYAITLRRRELVFSDGFLIVRHDAGRFVLLDDKEVVIDARSIREGESAESGGLVEFPCHLARIPSHPVGSSCLGDYFYDFYYEVESVVVRGPPVEKISISTSERSSPNAPSPKRSRIDHHKAAESSEGQTGASQNVTYGKSYSNNLDVVPENDYEEDSEEDHELLIDTIAREQMEKNQQHDGDIVRVCEDAIVEESSPDCKEPCNAATDTVSDLQQKATVTEAVPNINDTSALLKAPATPVVSKEIVCLGYHQNTYERSYASVVCNKERLSIPVVTEVGHDYHYEPVASPAYTVQSPEEESGGKSSIKAVDNNDEELEDGRRSMRNQQQKMEKVMDQAAALSKKRNLEGNPSSDEKLLPVKEIWERYVRSDDPIDVFNIKLKRVKKFLKGWGSNMFGNNKKKKQSLKQELSDLEAVEEAVGLYKAEDAEKIRGGAKKLITMAAELARKNQETPVPGMLMIKDRDHQAAQI